MHYVDFVTNKIYVDLNSSRVYFQSFSNAYELQEALQNIKYFKGFKNPKKYVTVLKKFQRETGIEIMY